MTRTKSANRRSYRRKGFIAKKKGGNCNGAAASMLDAAGPYPHSAQSGAGNLIQQPRLMGGSGSDLLSPGSIGQSPAIVGQAPHSQVGAGAGTTFFDKTAPLLKGGKKGKGIHKNPDKYPHGGSMLSEVAVPAVLLIANQTFGKRSRSNYKGKRVSRRRRNSRFNRR